MHVLDQTDLLLDLLREAGDEPVTLDELSVVGVHEPAQALYALELAGHSVHRVYEIARPGQSVTCVRLGAPLPPIAAPAARQDTVELPAVVRAATSAWAAPAAPAALAAPAAPAARADTTSRLFAAALLGALLLALVAAVRRPR
jgi:hypothetical protein